MLSLPLFSFDLGELMRYWGDFHTPSFESRREKTGLRGYNPVRNKSACMITEEGQKLETLDISRRRITLSI